jgi:hypothetical protein
MHTDKLREAALTDLVIEAIVEKLEIKEVLLLLLPSAASSFFHLLFEWKRRVFLHKTDKMNSELISAIGQTFSSSYDLCFKYVFIANKIIGRSYESSR